MISNTLSTQPKSAVWESGDGAAAFPIQYADMDHVDNDLFGVAHC